MALPALRFARGGAGAALTVPVDRRTIERAAGRAVGASRFLAVFAVLGLSLTTVATFAWAIAKSVRLVGDLLGGAWRDDLAIVDLLEVIDVYLIALVQLIVVIGLHELFIGDVDVPGWLEARSLEDLKKSIIDVLIVFLAVKGIEGLLRAEDPLDALTFAGATSVLLLSLTAFRAIRAGKGA